MSSKCLWSVFGVTQECLRSDGGDEDLSPEGGPVERTGVHQRSYTRLVVIMERGLQ